MTYYDIELEKFITRTQCPKDYCCINFEPDERKGCKYEFDPKNIDTWTFCKNDKKCKKSKREMFVTDIIKMKSIVDEYLERKKNE